MKEPHSKKEHLQKIWEYECVIDSVRKENQLRFHFEAGGNVFELPDRSIFCCMGNTYSKVFIISRDKKILWSAVPEYWSKTDKKWKMFPSYRASIITRKELESLIWGEPLKKR